jgi:hypothetical protein
MMKKFLYLLLQFTWGLPQSLIGFFVYLANAGNGKEKFRCAFIARNGGNFGGISLGAFIVVNGKYVGEKKKRTEIHEYGHTIQSLILGPLYLLIIGIPSAVWCNAKRFIEKRKKENISYFSFSPEKWADILGARVCGLSSPDSES